MEVLIDSVWLAFGEHQVLCGAHLRLPKGKVTGMLGRNGTGKSCLLKILTGQLMADNAYVGVDGQYQENLYSVPGLINYLPQFTCHPEGMRLSRLLDLYGVERSGFVNRYGHMFPAGDPAFGALSGGTQRLFEVLLVLAADTHFTLLDEPFSHVMPLHIDFVKEEIKRATVRKGVYVTDHKYEHVLDLADTLYLLHSGTAQVVKDLDDLVHYGYLSVRE